MVATPSVTTLLYALAIGAALLCVGFFAYHIMRVTVFAPNENEALYRQAAYMPLEGMQAPTAPEAPDPASVGPVAEQEEEVVEEAPGAAPADGAPAPYSDEGFKPPERQQAFETYALPSGAEGGPSSHSEEGGIEPYSSDGGDGMDYAQAF